MAKGQRHPFEDVGHRIADLRKALGRKRGRRVSQKELADYIPVHEGTVTAWEIGKQKPEGGNLVRLAEFLETTPDELLGYPVTTRTPGVVSESARAYVTKDAERAQEIIADLAQAAKHIRGAAEPGQELARKRAAWEGWTRAGTALGWQFPEWWFQLQEQIEHGEV